MLLEGPRRRTRVTVPGVVGYQRVSVDVWALEWKWRRGKSLGGNDLEPMTRGLTHIPGYGIGRASGDDFIEAGPADRIARWITDGSSIGRGYAGDSGHDEKGDRGIHINNRWKTGQ